MLHPHARPRAARALLPLLALLAAAPTAVAQIDLPRKEEQPAKEKPVEPPPRKGVELPAGQGAESRGRGVVPHLVCAVCGERNYTSARNRPTPGGFFEAWCGVCAQDRIHRPSEARAGGEGLDLPERAARPAPAPPAERAASAPKDGAQRTTPGPSRPVDRQAAAQLFRDLTAEDPLAGARMDQVVESLIALGEDGLLAARVALHEDTPARVMTAARVLLAGGADEDVRRVVDRLKERLPKRLGPRLLIELMRADPVHGSPELLVELLEHPQLQMRTSATHELQKQLRPELLPLLARALDSKRSETRLAAVQLVAQIDDPGVFDVLAPHLDDPAARVASEVVSAVAALDEPRVPLELEALAFNGRWTLRENAYALLALIEREDLTLQPILDERHAEPLLRALGMTDAFVYGTCAAALAGIGFRSADPEATAWLDREVTGRLVSVVSGREFHPDYSALQPRAQRRLELITGQSFGSDGPAWARWWIDSRETFYARRVAIALTGERVAQLELHYRATTGQAEVFTLFGPACDEAAVRARSGGGEVFRLTERECADLGEVLRAEGVLGAERMPGQRGERGAHQRKIEVLVDGRGKSFLFGVGASEPWFEALSAALRDVRDRNRWQRFPDLTRYATERGFWEAEASWWAEERDPLERALRMKELALKAAPGFSPSARNVVVDELERAYAVEGCASLDDFRPLVDLLRDEGFYVDRARRLLELCVRAGGAGAAPGGPPLPAELAKPLLDLLNARFGLESADDMARVATAAGPAYVRSLVDEGRPLLRAVGAASIGEELAAARARGESLDGEERRADVAALVDMLEDPEPFVEAAACLALGRAKVEEARTDLLVRARVGEPGVRAAALRAVSELGGEFVLEALVLGASAPDAQVRRAAAEGLARMKDPRTAPVLVSLLGQGPDEPVFEPARRGLFDLGEAAWAELARVANSPVHSARREALFVLAYQGLPRAAGGLIDLLARSPDDARVAEELAVLSCVDLRGAPDPVEAWSAWWQEVVHDDSQAWLRAAMERLGVSAPPPEALRGRGTREGALFLLEVAGRPEAHLAERGRRELERMLAQPLPAPQVGSSDRALWLATLRAEVGARFDS